MSSTERNGDCVAIGSICIVNQYSRTYCCPNENQEWSPPVVPPPIMAGSPSDFYLCIPSCINDAHCQYYQKCHENCPRYVNITFT